MSNVAYYVEKLQNDKDWKLFFTASEIKVILAAGEAWITKVNELIESKEMLPEAMDELYRVYRFGMIEGAESFDRDDVRLGLWERFKKWMHK